MQSDDEAPITLSKWPFYLGDVLLVATALAIAILGNWQLSGWEVFTCVLSVALGAALFVLPFIVEFYARAGEDSNDREAELKVVVRHLQNAEQLIDDLNERLVDLELQLSKKGQANDLLSAAVDQKIAAVEQRKAEQSKQVRQFEQQVEELTQQLQQMETQLSAQAASVEAIQAKPKMARSKRAPRQRKTPQARLIDRAISENPESTASAVNRIIKPIPRANQPEKENQSEPSTVEKPLEAADAPAASVEKSQEVSKQAAAKKRSKPSKAAKSGEAPASTVAEPVDLGVDLSSEPEAAIPVDLMEDMFVEAVPSKPKSRARVKKLDTSIVAKVLIGIGNKPYLRGSGAGLNWEEGIAMEFEEIGKWRWVAPTVTEETFEFQIYRNDEDPDKSGRHTLKPGEKVVVTPDF